MVEKKSNKKSNKTIKYFAWSKFQTSAPPPEDLPKKWKWKNITKIELKKKNLKNSISKDLLLLPDKKNRYPPLIWNRSLMQPNELDNDEFLEFVIFILNNERFKLEPNLLMTELEFTKYYKIFQENKKKKEYLEINKN